MENANKCKARTHLRLTMSECATQNREKKLNATFFKKSGLAWVLGFACQVIFCAVIGLALWKVLPVSAGTSTIGALLLTAPFTKMLFECLIASGFCAFFLSAWTSTMKYTIIVTLIVNTGFAIALAIALVAIGPVPGMALATL